MAITLILHLGCPNSNVNGTTASSTPCIRDGQAVLKFFDLDPVSCLNMMLTLIILCYLYITFIYEFQFSAFNWMGVTASNWFFIEFWPDFRIFLVVNPRMGENESQKRWASARNHVLSRFKHPCSHWCSRTIWKLNFGSLESEDGTSVQGDTWPMFVQGYGPESWTAPHFHNEVMLC